MTAESPRKVVIFRDHLLYSSETFIRAQAGALRRFVPIYAGSRRVPGLQLPADATYTINEGTAVGKLREARFKLFGGAPELVKQLRPLNPWLVHAHFGSDGLRAVGLADSLGLPLIVTFHGVDATVLDLNHDSTYRGHRQYLKNRHVLQRRASVFLTVSEFIRNKLLDQDFPPERVQVHYIGVDAKLFSPQQGERGLTILFVGRLVEYKGVEFLIRAMSEVQNEYPEAELVLIGDGPLRRQLEDQAKHSLRKYRFLGVQNSDVVRQWMDEASIFAAPSIRMLSGQEEAFGMVFAEAQAMQKPVVTFASGGIEEAVAHEETGFAAAEGDWRALAQYLALLLRDRKLRKRFGIAGRERVLRLFDLTKQTRLLEDIYDLTIEERKAS